MKISVSVSSLLLAAVSLQAIGSTTGWVHPGVLVTESQLEYVKSEIQAGNPVYVNLLNKAKGSNYGKKTYTVMGPPSTGIIQCGSYSNPDIGCRNANADSAAAYLQAVLWVLTDDVDYANKSIQILNAYKNLIGYAGFTPNVPCPADISQCSNGPLQAAWDASKWPRAAEIIRYAKNGSAGWKIEDSLQFADMLKRTVIPTIYNGSKNNGNWELSMIEAMMGIAVFTEDLSLLQHAQNMWKERIPAYFYSFSLDGNKPAPFPVNRATSNGWNGQEIFDATTDGVLQETCRDFQHAEMGFSAAINSAETDYIQQSYSATLYNAPGSAQRIITGANVLSGLEQAASTTAPMNFCTGRDGKLVLEGIATFAMAYNHYHNRMHDSRMADLSGTTGLRGTGNTYRWIQQGVITQNFYSDSGAKMVILEPLTHYDQPDVALPAYSLSMNPNLISIAPGQSGKSQITLTANSEYNRVVSLKLSSQIPPGVSATLSTTQISPQSPQADLQISTSPTTAALDTIISVIGDDGNKQFTTSTRLLITPVDKLVTVYANNAKVDYLQPLPTLSYRAQPDVAFTIKPGCSTTALPKSLPGDYPIRCNGAQLAGYRITYVDGILSVLPLKGVVTARNVSIKFGTPIPTVLRYSRAPSVALTKEPVCTTTATNTSPAGVYPITCRGAEAIGYVFDYINGTLTIRP